MTCCDCIPTPYSIKNTDETDVFADCIADTELYADAKKQILWDTYGDTGIGNTNVEYWERRVKAMYSRIKDEYDAKIRAWVDLCEKVKNSGASYADSVTETERSSSSDSQSKKKIDSGNLVVTNDLTSSTFDPPQTSGATVKNYLSDMSTDTGTVTTDDTRVQSTSGSASASDTETVKRSSGLETVSMSAWTDGVKNPLYGFAAEFKKLFYWGL